MDTAGGISSLILTLLVLGMVICLPFVATWQIDSRLKALGARSVEIEGLNINPTTGKISFDRFASVGPDGSNISVGKASIRLSLSALARRQITIQHLNVADSKIDLKLNAKGQWSVGGFSIVIEDDDAAPQTDNAWQLKASGISVRNSRMSLRIGQTTLQAMVETLSLDNVSTLRPNEPASLKLAAQAGGGKIKISGRAFPFAARPNAALTVDVSAFDLGSVEKLISTGRIKKLAGIAFLAGEMKAGMSASGSAEITYDGQVSLADAATDTTLFRTRSKSLSWSGDARIAFPGASANDAPPDIDLRGSAAATAFGFENRVTGMTLAAQSARFDLSETGVRIVTAGERDAPTRVNGSIVAQLTASELSQPDSGMTCAARQIALSGKLGLTLPPRTAAFTASLSGKIDTTAFRGGLSSAGVDSLNAAFLSLTSAQTDVEIAADGAMTSAIAAKFMLREFSLRAPELAGTAEIAEISSSGQKIDFSRTAKGDITLGLKGPIRATRLSSSDAGRRWTSTQSELSWTGEIAVGSKDGASQIAVSGDASAKGLKAALTAPESYIVTVDETSAKGISVKGGNVSIASATFDGFAASGAAQDSALPRLGLKNLRTVGLSVTEGRRVDIRSLRGAGLEGRFVRTRAGDIALPVFPDTADRAATAPVHKVAKTKPPGSIGIGDATVSSGRITFVDLAATPAFSIASSRLQASLSDFDTSEQGKDAQVRLLIGLGKFGRVEATGTMKPAPGRFTSDLGIGFKNIELSKFNAYVAPAIRHTVSEGRADGEIGLKLRGKSIDATSDLTITRLKVKPLPPANTATEKDGTGSGPPPIETAIGLLADSKGVMKLSIPVSGSIDDPKFDLSDAIGQAVAGAMQKTLLTAVKIAFPLGAVVAIVDAVGNPKIEIKPLAFSPGSTQLTAAIRSRIAEVGRYLTKRADEAPSICGVGTAADLAAAKRRDPKADKAAAIRIANERVRRVRDTLVSAHGIAAKRLFVCEAEYSDSPGASPSVTVELKS